MRNRRISSGRSLPTALSVSLSLAVLLQACPFTPALALAFMAPARRAQMQTPLDEKLDEGSGPSVEQLSDTQTGSDTQAGSDAQTGSNAQAGSDTQTGSTAQAGSVAQETRAKSKPDKKARAQKTARNESGSKTSTASALAPLTLADSNKDEAVEEESGSDGNGYLKSTVSMTGYVPKGPIGGNGPSLPSKSIKAGKSDSILEQARQVNAMPIPLMQSDDEMKEEALSNDELEKKQLAELWESALSRSPDIQFVVQKLMPTSEPGRATTVMLRMLSTAVMGGANWTMLSGGNMGSVLGAQMGASMIMNVLNARESKIAKAARITQTEAIMLYNMIRDTADKLVVNYRHYKTDMSTLNQATKDLTDLKEMIKNAREGQDEAKQFEMEYTIRKAQRDVNKLCEDVRLSRQMLVDVAGSDAVTKLDEQLNGPFQIASQRNDKPI